MFLKSGIGRRLLSIFFVVAVATILSFFILHMSPVDPVSLQLQRLGMPPNSELVAELRQKFGLDEPILVQYMIWLKGVCMGDFGYSILFGVPVYDLLKEAIPKTVILAVSSLVLSVVITVPMALLAFFYRHRLPDLVIRFMTFAGISIPTFWLSLLLIYWFAVRLGWLPVIARGWQGLILPSAALAVWMSGLYIRRLRVSILEEYQKDYIIGARTLGLSELTILFKYLLPNALPGVISMLGLTIGGLLGGSVVIETIFGWRGMGALMVESHAESGLSSDAGICPMGRGCLHFGEPCGGYYLPLFGSTSAEERGELMTLRKLCGNKMLLLSLVLVIIWLFLALISPWIVPQDPFAVHMEERLQAGSMIHWMGTDSLGRDEFSRILYGSRVTLGIAFCGVGLTAAFGIMIGASIAFAGGKVEQVGTTILDFFLAFPSRIFMIALIGVIGASVWGVIIALVLTTWPEYARITRTLVRTEREKGYVRYAPYAGAGFYHIIFSYILPNAIPQLLVFLCQHISEVILLVAGLSLIGIGVPPPSPEWGTLLMGAREYMQTAPWLLFYPGGAIFVTVVIFNLLGDALRDALDPHDMAGE